MNRTLDAARGLQYCTKTQIIVVTLKSGKDVIHERRM